MYGLPVFSRSTALAGLSVSRRSRGLSWLQLKIFHKKTPRLRGLGKLMRALHSASGYPRGIETEWKEVNIGLTFAPIHSLSRICLISAVAGNLFAASSDKLLEPNNRVRFSAIIPDFKTLNFLDTSHTSVLTSFE